METIDPKTVQVPGDVITAMDFQIPDNIPERARIAIVLKAFGLSNTTIADHLGITEAGIRYYLKKYDPEERYLTMSNKRRLYLSAMFETVAIECMSGIKAKDIQLMTPKDRINMAIMCSRAIRDIGAKPPEEKKMDEQAILEEFKREAEKGAGGIDGSRGGLDESLGDGEGAGLEDGGDGEQDVGTPTGVA